MLRLPEVGEPVSAGLLWAAGRAGRAERPGEVLVHDQEISIAAADRRHAPGSAETIVWTYSPG